MARRPWMPMYWKDYLHDTQHLTAEEHGVYLLLIAHYWTTGEPLPAGERELKIFVKNFAKISNYRWQKIEARIRSFFIQDGNVLRHKRIDAELAKVAEISEKQRARVNRRWRKENARGEYHGNGEMDTAVSSEPIQTSHYTNIQTNNPQSRKPRARAPEAPHAASTQAIPWERYVALFQSTGRWVPRGPRPDCAGCRAPRDILEKFGYGVLGERQNAPESATEARTRAFRSFPVAGTVKD